MGLFQFGPFCLKNETITPKKKKNQNFGEPTSSEMTFYLQNALCHKCELFMALCITLNTISKVLVK